MLTPGFFIQRVGGNGQMAVAAIVLSQLLAFCNRGSFAVVADSLPDWQLAIVIHIPATRRNQVFLTKRESLCME